MVYATRDLGFVGQFTRLPLRMGRVATATFAGAASAATAALPLRLSPTHRLEPIREAVREGIQKRLSSQERAPMSAFSAPVGDPGLFGPTSVTWRVHGDLPSMMIGGMSALMLQALHPLAMAGVAEHSKFREDPLGRLQRTAAFVGVTTYGSTPAANEMIALVRRVHHFVHGTAPDGRPYDANDPHLLTWVHSAEVISFWRAYRRYSGHPWSRAEEDRYYAETSQVAEALGARDVPKSSAQMKAYFESMRQELEAGDQAREALDFIVKGAGHRGSLSEELVRGILVQASMELLFGWARSMYRMRPALVPERLVVRQAAGVLGAMLRWAIGPSEVIEKSTARCQVAAAA